jgi:FlaA1/EpsC-like NDP-sugar epimerase
MNKIVLVFGVTGSIGQALSHKPEFETQKVKA